MSYRRDNNGYRAGLQNGGYRRGPGGGYRRGASGGGPAWPVTVILGETPTFVYTHGLGSDASAAGWAATDYGTDLDYVGSGTDPDFNDGSDFTLAGANDSVQFNAGEYYEKTGDATYGDLGTNDFWLKIVHKFHHANTTLIGKLAGNVYWEIQCLISGSVRFLIGDGTTSQTADSQGLANDTWFVHDVVGDRSGSVRVYTDGQPAVTKDISSINAVSPASDFTVGSRTGGSAKNQDNLAYAALWLAAGGWLDSHDQDALVLEHYNNLIAG